jgi:hypothetical protein
MAGHIERNAPMTTSRTARKVIGAVSAVVVSVMLVGGVAAATSTDDAGRGIVRAAK